MPPFEIVSEYQPTGDQPQAITSLVQGLSEGLQFQTLLGATGTGKSLGSAEPVFVVRKTTEGSTAQVVPIGKLIDDLMQSDAILRYDGDTEILDADGSYYAQSFDPQTGKVDLYPIGSFIRHQTPDKMYHIQTKCGRSAILTGDHNLWVLRDGSLQLIRTVDAHITDYLPVPDTLLSEGTLTSLDMLPVLSGKRLFVDASEPILAFAEKHGISKTVEALSQSQIASPYSKLSAIRQHIRGGGIEVSKFQQFLKYTNNIDGFWQPTKASIGAKKAANRLPVDLELTPELLRFMGYYIAEGNHQRGYVIIANQAPVIRNQIEAFLSQHDIPFGIRPNSDFQISSTALTEMLSHFGGDNARDKHLPDFWPDLTDVNLGQLLSAYFDGDGTVGHASDVSAITASSHLASDLTYALLRFGIWARISRKWKRATNTDHVGDWYYQVTISGQTNLRCFRDHIGFSLEYKQVALDGQLGRDENSNVDIVPIDGTKLRWLRNTLGLTAKALGNRVGLSRSGVQFYELNQRAPGRPVLRKLLAALYEIADQQGSLTPDWVEVWQDLDQLWQLRWTPITAVKPVEYTHPYVYDFCVPGVENFLAGNGGFFVHNTFAIAKVVDEIQRPTLVIAHNKTLAAQLYAEFKEFFPRNAVEYFVSYYDYYQPEAYVPRIDLYIEKEADINEEIERLRLAATAALMSRRDVLIVASVSCIYGLGNPTTWADVTIELSVGQSLRRDTFLRRLVQIQYDRNDLELRRGTFRVRGDTLEVTPAYGETTYRIILFGDEIERIVEFDPLTGEIITEHETFKIFPAKHYIADTDKMRQALTDIESELDQRLSELRAEGKLLEVQRLEQRTRYDLEMIREVGYCSGIENYSRHMDQRPVGSPPWTLLDYFPEDYLLVIDESHMSVPQIRGMYAGDRSRKTTLIDYGFRLPCALDNRPLNFDEFEARIGQVIFTSATPGPYEAAHAQKVVQQVIRPTGIVDPEISVRPIEGQVDNLLKEISIRIKRSERILVTTLTKRMAEDLSKYLAEMSIRVHYLHSEIDTIQRIEILRDLRLGVYDVVVGINLLREGLDLPEVSLVAILDADKEGFLRSSQALIQTIGRAARHINGQVIMYADRITDSMRRAIDETDRRRAIQVAYNIEHNIQPASIVKQIRDLTDRVKAQVTEQQPDKAAQLSPESLSVGELHRMVSEIEKAMKAAAKELEFEKAAALRDQILELRRTMVLKEQNFLAGGEITDATFDDDLAAEMS